MKSFFGEECDTRHTPLDHISLLAGCGGAIGPLGGVVMHVIVVHLVLVPVHTMTMPMFEERPFRCAMSATSSIDVS